MPNVFVEIAEVTSSRVDFERRVLDELDRTIGYDVAFFVSCEAPTAPTTARFQMNPFANVERGILYGHELTRVKASALGARGVAVDADVLGARMRECAYYRDLVVPHGGGTSYLAYLRLRGELRGMVMLGRCGRGARFRANEITLGEALVGSIAVAHASYRPPPRPELALLSPREREIVDYLCLGYTNREIALACTLSPNTVRNCLARVFEKIGASTRAEAVSIARA